MRPEYSRFRSATFRISRLSHGSQTKTRLSRAPGLPRLARVLVVDDNRDIVTTLTAFLRMDGYETCEAFDGFEALQALDLPTELPAPVADLIPFMSYDKKTRGGTVRFALLESLGRPARGAVGEWTMEEGLEALESGLRP